MTNIFEESGPELPEYSEYQAISWEEICALCGVDPAEMQRDPADDLAESLSFHAFDLTQFGLEIDSDIDQPSLSSLPYYDGESDTALWIGVVRDTVDDKRAKICVLAVENVLFGDPQASIAPCYDGDFKQALALGEQLTEALYQNNDLAHFLGVVEGMARAHHVPDAGKILNEDTAHDLCNLVDRQLGRDMEP